MDKLIYLSINDIIADGGRRTIYKHPEYNNRLIKVPKMEELVSKRKRAPFYKRIRPLFMFDENYKDFFAYSLYNRKDKKIFDFIPKSYGFVKTNIGKGLSVEWIKNFDGSISITVEEYIRQNGLDDKIKKALMELFDKIYETAFVCRELTDFNIVVKRLNDKNDIKLYIIDGFGNQEFIPISSFFKFLARRKILKHKKLFWEKLKY